MSSLTFPLPIVFYGSLMRGLGGAEELGISSELRFVSACEIPGRLVDLGDYPGLLSGPGRVLGELFEVLQPETLAALDYFEGYDSAHPESSLYLRKTTQLISPQRLASVYLYNQTSAGYEQVRTGDWRTYLAQRKTS
ncbi:MAG: gamma-glutamylcyclotransferase [Myxococcota bacterium]|nr:gamma-glutamylcyclotransferase [Myxococcota bacterium]